jgi:hypothetical protein
VLHAFQIGYQIEGALVNAFPGFGTGIGDAVYNWAH